MLARERCLQRKGKASKVMVMTVPQVQVETMACEDYWKPGNVAHKAIMCFQCNGIIRGVNQADAQSAGSI